MTITYTSTLAYVRTTAPEGTLIGTFDQPMQLTGSTAPTGHFGLDPTGMTLIVGTSALKEVGEYSLFLQDSSGAPFGLALHVFAPRVPRSLHFGPPAGVPLNPDGSWTMIVPDAETGAPITLRFSPAPPPAEDAEDAV
jgi:hypothetical protein